MGIFTGYLISRWKVNVWNWDFCVRLLFSDLKTREYEPLPLRGTTVFISLTTKETFASGNYINKNTIRFSENISNSVFKMIQLYHVVDIFKKTECISVITVTHFGTSNNSILKNMTCFTFFLCLEGVQSKVLNGTFILTYKVILVTVQLWSNIGK